MGRIAHYLPSCHSTNDFALQLLQKPAVKSGTIVITDLQTKGRGQRGNGWESENGSNLLFSIILKPEYLKASEQFRLNILISNALVAAIKSVINVDVKIKWPNDIFYKEQKLAGILIESLIQGKEISYTVAGVGINVNQTLFQTQGASSLRSICGEELDRVHLLEEFLRMLEDSFDTSTSEKLELQKVEYLSNLFAFREWRLFEDFEGQFEGRIVGITELGEILIEREKGLNKYQMKEFRYIFDRSKI